LRPSPSSHFTSPACAGSLHDAPSGLEVTRCMRLGAFRLGFPVKRRRVRRSVHSRSRRGLPRCLWVCLTLVHVRHDVCDVTLWQQVL